VGIIVRSLSTPVTEAQIIAAIDVMEGMARKQGDDVGADKIVSDFVEVIQDEGNGIVPACSLDQSQESGVACPRNQIISLNRNGPGKSPRPFRVQIKINQNRRPTTSVAELNNARKPVTLP